MAALKDPSASFYCKECNRDVGPKWMPTCCFHDCRALGGIVAGNAPKVGASWVRGGGKPTLLKNITEDDYERIATGTREFDRVLGGGIVTGSIVLISGDPGIGKSTLLLQVAIDLSEAEIIDESTKEKREPLVVLYVSAEETSSQIKGRAVRLDGANNPVKDRALVASKESRRLYILNECDVEEIEKHIFVLRPDILIIDSIQTMLKPGVDGGPGSVTQVRECAIHLTGICKKSGIGCFLVAHVNKDNVIAGPKTLEHLVDATLEFHKEGLGELRSIRPNKNRFGDTNEMALFRMTGDGLRSIENPSELLLEHHKDGSSGVCIGLAATGPRPFAVEVQTLLGPTLVNDSASRQFRRILTGLSNQRATQVIAILQRRLGLNLDREIFVNVPGGLDEIKDPALDLPLALALVSYALDTTVPDSFIAYGEIGLAGEIRPVSYNQARIKSAALMGFKMIVGPIVPAYETDFLASLPYDEGDGQEGPPERYYGVASLQEAFDLLEGFVITPHEPKKGKVKPEKRKKNPLQLVRKDDE